MWYMGWPSRGVPDDPSTIIAFLIEARAFMRNPSAQGQGRQAARAAPHVVHCSPGTGRTGTVLAIDLCIREFETTRQVDIPRTVYRLRKDRAGCVQTKEQYMFVYKVRDRVHCVHRLARDAPLPSEMMRLVVIPRPCTSVCRP